MALPYATANQLKLLEQKTKSELDKKTENINLTADTLEDMNALITKGSITDGQICYCKEDKKLYVLKDGVWVEVGGGGGIPVVEGTESTTTTDGAYATYTIPEAQTSCFIFKCNLGTAFISYNDVFGTYNGYLDAEGDVTDGSLKLNDLIVLSGSGTTIDIFFGNIGGSGGSGLPIVQATLSGTIGEIKTYTIPEKQTSPFILSIDGNYVLTSVSASGDDYYGEYYSGYKYYYISGGDTSILLRENTSFVIGSKIVPLFTDYNILVDKQSNKTEILPCTTADNGKVLSVVNGEAQWASASGSGSGGTKFDIVQFSDDGVSYTGTITGSNPIILKTDWDFIVPQKYTYVEGLVNTCEVIDNNKVTTYLFNNGKYTTKISFIFYIHFITLTNSTDSIYIQYPTSDPDYKEPLDMTHLKRVLSGKKALCSGVLGNSDETRARPLYVAGNAQLTVYYVLNSNTDGTISEKSIENYTISDVVTPLE